jgi:HTH-type transcriptional regulator / antitoxin HigA
MNTSEYKKVAGQIEVLLQRGFANLSPDELKQLEAWGRQVAHFERENYAIPVPDTLPEMIELKMYEQKLNQKALAQRMGISSAKLSLIMNGKQEPDLTFLKQCKRVLGISADFILEHA